MTSASPLKRLGKALVGPLWTRLRARIQFAIRTDAYLDQRLRDLEVRAGATDLSIAEMKLQTNHVPVLDKKIGAMELQTNHVPVLDKKVASFAADAPTLDFRLDQLRREIDQKYAAEVYVLKQAAYEVRADQETFDRQLNTIKQALGGDDLGFAQLRAAVGRLEGQFIHLRAGLAQMREAQAQLAWRGDETAHSKLAQDWVMEEWTYLSPMDVLGKEFIRVGRNGDGGYVMINDLASLRFALSFGVGTEMSWDLELAEWGIHVLLYDHTIPDIPTQHPNIKFRPIGLGHSDLENSKRRLPDILNEEDLAGSGDIILKVDIEGNEWEALRDVPSETLGRFSQILIELHGMSDFAEPDSHIGRMYVLKKLQQTHQVVHLHANNWGIHKIIGGVPVPDVIEVTFASRKRYGFAPCTRTFPTPLDYPNNADRADIVITLPVTSGAANGSQVSKTH